MTYCITAVGIVSLHKLILVIKPYWCSLAACQVYCSSVDIDKSYIVVCKTQSKRAKKWEEEVYSNLVTKTPHRHAIALRTVLITSKQ